MTLVALLDQYRADLLFEEIEVFVGRTDVGGLRDEGGAKAECGCKITEDEPCHHLMYR